MAAGIGRAAPPASWAAPSLGVRDERAENSIGSFVRPPAPYAGNTQVSFGAEGDHPRAKPVGRRPEESITNTVAVRRRSLGRAVFLVPLRAIPEKNVPARALLTPRKTKGG